MPADPLVTILITARNRPNELRRTLAELSRQTYRPVELLVIDDASDSSLEPIVRESWADSRFERNSVNRGLVASRSVGMQIAAGEFVASLDDDSCFTQPDALERAVSRMKAEPEIGILTFLLHNGRVAPADCPAMPERYVASFTGGGSLIRRKVIQQIGGYRDFYFYYGEESEYSLRTLDAGWRILFFPGVLVHHRVAPSGRNQSRLLGYSLRNHLLTALLNLPWRRAAVEGFWKLAVYGLEALRRMDFRCALWALGSLAGNLPNIRRFRKPVAKRTLRLYDALRFTAVTSSKAYEFPPRLSFAQRLRWFRDIWWHRRRARACWDPRPGGIGSSPTAQFAKQEPV